MYAAVTDDPNDQAAEQELVMHTVPFVLSEHYVMDKDCVLFPAAQMLKDTVLRALYPRESA